ncbi:hypothetical protein LXL04_020806 [Taraxacum kok-saghyz]
MVSRMNIIFEKGHTATNNIIGLILDLPQWKSDASAPDGSLVVSLLRHQHPTNPGSNPSRRDNNNILSNPVSHKGVSLLWTRFKPGNIPPETPGRGKLEYASDQLNWTSLADTYDQRNPRPWLLQRTPGPKAENAAQERELSESLAPRGHIWKTEFEKMNR